MAVDAFVFRGASFACAIHDVLGGTAEAKVRAAVVQWICVYVVNLEVGGSVEDFAVHICDSAVFVSSGVEAGCFLACVPFVFAKLLVIGLINNCEFALC